MLKPDNMKPPLSVYFAIPTGQPLTREELDNVARTYYMRFVHYEGQPEWRDPKLHATREKLTDMVAGVVDCLAINNHWESNVVKKRKRKERTRRKPTLQQLTVTT